MDEFVSKKLLVAKFNELASKYTDGDKRQRGLAYATAADIIAFTDAVDVQPARFARWIDLDNRILCSGCGAGYDDSDEVKQNTYIFCPNCGAKMDGDKE